jgi:hypothetical protein
MKLLSAVIVLAALAVAGCGSRTVIQRETVTEPGETVTVEVEATPASCIDALNMYERASGIIRRMFQAQEDRDQAAYHRAWLRLQKTIDLLAPADQDCRGKVGS